jgi:serine/threonine-protein kinase
MPASLDNEAEQTVIRRGGPTGTGAWRAPAVGHETRDVAPAASFGGAPAAQADGRALETSDELPAPSVTGNRAPHSGEPGPFAAPPAPGAPGGHSLPPVPGYALLAELARGGMGVVFTARDRMLNRDVAVKTLLPGAAANPVAFRRFVTEARITARLCHPAIPPVYALGSLPDGRPFLAMKLVRGRTLAAVLAGRAERTGLSDDGLELTALHAPGLLHVFEQICQAVGYAHSQDVIHRDLKPANVMLGAFGEVQVMDWGLARELGRGAGSGSHQPLELPEPPPGVCGDTAVHALGDTEQSRIGEALGTPAFMPPEQAQGDWDNVDARADVFALGGILCVILTGQPPYTGRNVVEVVRRAVVADLAEAFARLDSCGADPGLVALAKQCLSPRREDRLPNAAAVAISLQSHQFEAEERARAAAAARATAAVRLAERKAKAGALAAERQRAEERLREAEGRAKARESERSQRHWTITAILVLAIVVLACLFQQFRDGRRGHPAPAELAGYPPAVAKPAESRR